MEKFIVAFFFFICDCFVHCLTLKKYENNLGDQFQFDEEMSFCQVNATEYCLTEKEVNVTAKVL